MNVIPTPATRAAVANMLSAAEKAPATDALLRHLHDLRPEQMPAAIALLLSVKSQPRQNGSIAPLTLTENEARRGHALYQQGVRTPFAVLAEREYKRAAKRRQRAARARNETTRQIEEAMFTEEEARAARTAYENGDRSDRAILGARVYYRRIKAKGSAA